MKNRAPHKQHDESGKRIPIRTCAVCRSKMPQREVLRLGRDAAGLLQPDPKRRMAGRGVYLCTNPQCRTPKALGRVARADALRLGETLNAHFIAGQPSSENPMKT